MLAQGAVEALPRENADFPQYDLAAWHLERTGLIARAAARRLREAPDSADTLAFLIEAHRIDDALHVLRRIVEKRPEDMARAFEAVSRDSRAFHDQAREYSETLQQLIDAARGKLRSMTAEQAARTERQLLMVDGRPLPRNSFTDRLEEFVTEYRGTETALLTEVDIIRSSRVSPRQLELLDEIVRDHPGSVAGAKALYMKGLQLSVNAALTGIEPRNADITWRLLQVLDIVEQLKSGRFPTCEWVDRSLDLVTTFFVSDPVRVPENVEGMLAAYYRVAKTYFTVSDSAPLSGGTGRILAQLMAKLFELHGEGFPGVERTARDLERDSPDPSGAVYLRALLYVARLNSRALFYMGETSTIDDVERSRMFQNAVEALDSLSRGQSRYQRKALATLATLYFERLDYSSARDRYQAYLAQFPGSDYAWVAALRIGQCEEGMRNWRAATDAYRRAAAKYRAIPIGAVLGHSAAARMLEGQAQWDRAGDEYQRALAAWDSNEDTELALNWVYVSLQDRPTAVVKDLLVERASLSRRVEELKSSATTAGGPLLERGRWLLAQQRWSDARAPLEQFLTEYPRSAAIPAARYLAHLARLEHALELANGTDPEAHVSRAIDELESLIRQPYDFVVCAAQLTKASILWKEGRSADADPLMRSALAEWGARQRSQNHVPPKTTLERDVISIRNVVFRPSASGPLGIVPPVRSQSLPPPFLLVSSQLKVATAAGEIVTVSTSEPLPATENALFVNAEQIALLKEIAGKIGGSDPKAPLASAAKLATWWNGLFQVGGPAWGSIDVETYPIIFRIEFIDAQRTRAVVSIRTSISEGAAVVVRKEGGTWKVMRVVNRWIA